MGYYINTNSKGRDLPSKGKVQVLITDGATIVPEPSEFTSNLVCVVENPLFDAAGYCYSSQEMKHFKYPDGRKRTWLIYEHAQKLSGYQP